MLRYIHNDKSHSLCFTPLLPSFHLYLQLELCAAYASGYYGSITRQDAMATIRDVMMASRPLETHRIFTVQEDITNVMRYIHIVHV